MSGKKPSRRIYGLVASIAGVATVCFLIIPYMIFPQFYIPKPDGGIGYTAPATVEGWILMIAGLAALIVTIISMKLFKNA